MTSFVLDNDLVGTLMQGVIITDGYADGWVVDNNLIVSGQEHGVSLYGGRNCRVQNNTVVAHPAFPPSAGPWSRITDQTKTGQANFDNVIRNNLAQMVVPWDYDPSSLVEANLEITAAEDQFVDALGLNFGLLPSSAAANAGVNADLATVDLDGYHGWWAAPWTSAPSSDPEAACAPPLAWMSHRRRIQRPYDALCCRTAGC